MSFTYQQWKKRESEQRILNVLKDGNKSYGELLEQTKLSKPILSKRLKSLTKQGKIETVAETETKRFLYHLIEGSLDELERGLVLLHQLSKYVLDHLETFAENSSVSNEEYAERLIEGITMLFNFKLFELTISPGPIGEEWLKNALGLEFVRRLPKLFLENREVFPNVLKGISPGEQAIYQSGDAKEAAKQLVEHLETLVKRLPLD